MFKICVEEKYTPEELNSLCMQNILKLKNKKSEQCFPISRKYPFLLHE